MKFQLKILNKCLALYSPGILLRPKREHRHSIPQSCNVWLLHWRKINYGCKFNYQKAIFKLKNKTQGTTKNPGREEIPDEANFPIIFPIDPYMVSDIWRFPFQVNFLYVCFSIYVGCTMGNLSNVLRPIPKRCYGDKITQKTLSIFTQRITELTCSGVLFAFAWCSAKSKVKPMLCRWIFRRKRETWIDYENR